MHIGTGEISRHAMEVNGQPGMAILVVMGSPLCEELERAYICHLYGDKGTFFEVDVLFERGYTGQVVDWFCGDGVDTPVVWSYDNRIEWRLVNIQSTVSNLATWQELHGVQYRQWEWL